MTTSPTDGPARAAHGVAEVDLRTAAVHAGSAPELVRSAPTAPGSHALLLLLDERLVGSDALVVAVADSPVPVVAVVEGRLVGRQVAVALAADLRVGSPGTVLRVEPLVGGTSASLPRVVPAQVARRLLMDPVDVDAAQALDTGLLDAVDDDPVATGRALAARVAAAPGQGAAVRRALTTWQHGGDVVGALQDEERLRAVVDLHR